MRVISERKFRISRPRYVDCMMALRLSARICSISGLREVRRLTPSHTWCAAVNAARPGDEIVFAPGQYREPCSIRVSGSAAAEILIRTESETDRATLTYPGSTANVIEV